MDFQPDLSVGSPGSVCQCDKSAEDAQEKPEILARRAGRMARGAGLDVIGLIALDVRASSSGAKYGRMSAYVDPAGRGARSKASASVRNRFNSARDSCGRSAACRLLQERARSRHSWAC